MEASDPPCTVEAIHVAWKVRERRYRSAEGAIRVLRRVDVGLTAEQARQAIVLAGSVLREAIRIVEPRDLPTLEAYRSRVPNGPDAELRRSLRRELEGRFPTCTAGGVRSALELAIVHHIL